MPPTDLLQPDYPFHMVAADYFFHAGHTYLVVVDRYSGWPCVSRCREESAAELIRLLRLLFCVHGVPEEFATDRASVFTARQTQKFLETWGVRHRVSSAYFPHSNLRAETGVKLMKRLIKENVGTGGSLDTDRFTAALQLINIIPGRAGARMHARLM